MIASRLAPLVALVALAPAAALGQPAAAPEQATSGDTQFKTVAVVALAGYERLMEDVDLLGELGDRPGSADMIEGMLAFMTGGRGLEGLDKSRPIGVVLRTDGSAFTPLTCLPIPDLDPFLILAENFGLEPLLGDNGVYEVETPDQTLFVKQSGEWTYVSQATEALANVPADPSGPLKQIVGSYDLGATILASNVPDMYRQIALEQLRQGMEEGLQQDEDESDEDFESRRKLAEAQTEELSNLIEGLDRITVGLTIDSSQKRLYLDAVITSTEGSDLALAMSAYDNPTSGITAFHRPGATMSMLTSGTTPAELLEKNADQIESTLKIVRVQMRKALAEAREEALEAASESDGNAEQAEAMAAVAESFEPALDDLIDAYGDVLRDGRAEFAASLALEGQQVDLIAGAYVPDPSKVVSAFKKVAEAADREIPEFPGVEWDYAEHAGVTLHRMSVPVPDDPNAPAGAQPRVFLGDTLTILLGVGEKYVYAAVGPQAEKSLKAAIDSSAEMADEEVRPVEGVMSVTKFLELMEKFGDNPQAKMVAGMMLEALEDAPPGTDRLLLTVEPVERGARVRFLMEEGVMRALGKSIAAGAAMQAQGGGPPGF